MEASAGEETTGTACSLSALYDVQIEVNFGTRKYIRRENFVCLLGFTISSSVHRRPETLEKGDFVRI